VDWQYLKKGVRHNSNNYREIQSSRALLQLYANIFENHIRRIEEVLLSDKQNGFKEG
jgi:hypothetical protein